MASSLVGGRYPPGFDVQDMEAPRRNLLMFYGVGGMGKSILSRKIEAVLSHTAKRPAGWAAPPAGRLLPIRIDLARSTGIDFEQIVLRLPFASPGRPMLAFDLFLRRWWEQHHPGESLEDYLPEAGCSAALPAR